MSLIASPRSVMPRTPPAAPAPSFASPQTRALARIEAHYFVNHSFIEEGQILRNAGHLSAIPGIIVQGRYDSVTPPVTAYELHQLWPNSLLEIVPDAGHATVEAGIQRALVAATERFADL